MTDNISEPIEPEEVLTKTVNNNGQIYLGRDLAGEDIRVAYQVIEKREFVCGECEDSFELADVAIFNRGGDDERIVCTDCLEPEDRIIS